MSGHCERTTTVGKAEWAEIGRRAGFMSHEVEALLAKHGVGVTKIRAILRELRRYEDESK